MRVSGYVLGVVLVANIFVSQPASAILFKSTANPAYNTNAPGGALLNSGWQYEGSWGGFLGTPVAPNFFLAAHHIGGVTGQVFTLNGFLYHTTAFFDDPSSDLRLWRTAETFPVFAPLYPSANEVGKHCLIFGCGTQRGTAVLISGMTNGWQWGLADGVQRWGENDVGTIATDASLGDFLSMTFDRNGNSNECDFSVGDSSGAVFIQSGGVWQLAGINYGVDGPFSNAVDGTEFDAALVDRGGLFQLVGTNWTFITNTGADNPSSFYSTRVSSHIAWINGVISNNSPVAPAASFTVTPTSGIWPLTVTFTDTSTGTLTNRFWSFGDGVTTNTTANILSHTYANPGSYTITQIVSGPAGSSANPQPNAIDVINPPHLSIQPSTLAFGLLADGQSSNQQFLVINTGNASLIGTAQLSGVSSPFVIASGSPFNVNGGQTSLVSVTFSPISVGAFTNSIIFTSNGGGSTNIVIGSSAIAPAANFFTTPTNGATPLLVNFTDASSGTVTSRLWIFGDGSTSILTSPNYTYTNAGTFSVSLTAFGPLGSNTLLLPNLITVTNILAPAVAAFTANPLIGPVPLTVSFTDTSTGTITNFAWTFGDSGTSSAVSPSHTYSNAGVYSVGLTVSGPLGSSASNFLNLITVTNFVNIPPTITLLRPGNGMLYPPLTNLTITLVASAAANDGSTISKIEFFVDGTKLGETTLNTGTNFLVNPSFGSHALTARATDSFGVTNTSATATILVGAKNSPVGDWEVTVAGADKGAAFLTFADDFTANGFGIRLKTFGLNEINGTWNFNAKGQLTGPFLEMTGNTTNWTGTALGTFKSLKSLSATVPTASGAFHWKGIPATTFPDLSGTWAGIVTVAKTDTSVSYLITSNVTDAAVFDIAASATPSTVIGQILVTSRNRVYAYLTFAGQPITFSGTFNAKQLSLTLKGTGANLEKVSIKILR